MSKREEIATKAAGSGAFSSPGSGAVLDKHDIALAAPTAATGTFNQKVWHSGNLVEVIGMTVPLCITPEIASLLYVMWNGVLTAAQVGEVIGHPDFPNMTAAKTGAPNTLIAIDDSLYVNQIKSAYMLSKASLTTEDLLYSMARTTSGRVTLMRYSQPSDIFITNGGVDPMFVASYFYKYYGLTVPRDAAGNFIAGSFTIDPSVNQNTLEGKATLTATLKSGSIRTRR